MEADELRHPTILAWQRVAVSGLLTMACCVDFHFDFSSPYGFLAAMKIEAVLGPARYRRLRWRPFLLGAVTGAGLWWRRKRDGRFAGFAVIQGHEPFSPC